MARLRTFGKLPAKVADFISYLTKNSDQAVPALLQPYKEYEQDLRETFAQEPDHAVVKDQYANAVPIFSGSESELKIRARNLENEDEIEKSKYIMPLSTKMRKQNGSAAVVSSLKEFQKNFSIFSESALSELDWTNVIAAGSSVLTPLLPVPAEHAESKRTLRDYYHLKFAPSSDVDLFLYGLNEEQALEKIKEIERSIKDSILTETVTVRTKNAITIASKYPTRHVQIVLRIYKSISEIITGFDVDSSCVAYDGKQVYASPRAIAALVTQVNHVDLTRRSPSYESRLSKYSKRGFEVYWPELDRTRIDPTIFERSFARTLGLARLLVLEKLPTEQERSVYVSVRREERGRPQINFTSRHKNSMRGNIKENFDDEVADWQYEDSVSNYHSFTIPYGEKFHSRRIERLLYTKDLLLNAEWNIKKDRHVNLHRHPAFFGDAADVFEDCCGHCPVPANEEEERIALEESKHYISGKISFLLDDPGRQEIGSFNPITDQDWTEMAYITDTGRLCQAIVDHNLTEVEKLLDSGSVDPNARDYTGRTMLHLSIMTSTAEIVKCLLDHGAYIVPRVASGETSMHLASSRGDVDIINLLHEKSDENKAQAEKIGQKEPDIDMIEHSDVEDDASEASVETSNFVKVESAGKFMKDSAEDAEVSDANKIEPKDDILDPDAVAWDLGCTPQHIAAVFGHVDALKYLLEEFGSDPRIPIKIKNTYNNLPAGAILSLVLALHLPKEQSEKVTQALTSAGASCSQADLQGTTAFQYFVNSSCDALELLIKYDNKRALSVINHIGVGDSSWNLVCRSALMIAICNHDEKTALRLLELGAKPEVTFEDWQESFQKKFKNNNMYNAENRFKEGCEQPVFLAIENELPNVVRKLIECGASANTINGNGHKQLLGSYVSNDDQTWSVLDAVQAKISELTSYSPTKSAEPDAPEPPKTYLETFSEGSWAHWSISTKYKQQLREHELQVKQRSGQTIKNLEEGEKLKEQAIRNLTEDFEALEEYLSNKDAKSYIDLHVSGELQAAMREAKEKAKELKKLENEQRKDAQATKPQTESLNQRLFANHQGLLDADIPGYIRLFSAAWYGDFRTVRELTIIPRGENKDKPPLKIGVVDVWGLNPFLIAIIRGHVDTALKMVPIAQAQYQPKDTKLSYTMNDNNEYDCDDYKSNVSDENSESGSDDGNSPRLQIYSRLPAAVRDQFTIEDIGEISTAVKSYVSPTDFMGACGRFENMDLQHVFKSTGSSSAYIPRYTSAFAFAIYAGDITLFNQLLGTANDYCQLAAQTNDDKLGRFVFGNIEIDYALRAGRTEMLSIMMSKACAGLPLAQLAKKSGVTSDDKPKYYPGLSIRGKKNENWAASHRGGLTPTAEEQPLVLRAAESCNVKSLEWLLSDAPIRLWKEYAANNKDDERLKPLLQSEIEFEKVVADWLDKDSKYALHFAIGSQTTSLIKTDETNEELRNSELEKTITYIIKAIPESLNAKMPSGMSPIQHAVFVRQYNIAKIIIEEGADLNARDNNANNLMHSMLGQYLPNSNLYNPNYANSIYRDDHQIMEKFIKLIGVDKCKELLLSRNKSHQTLGNGRTPVHTWVYNTREAPEHSCRYCSSKTLELLLKYAPEAITMLDSSGDTPVHTAILYPRPAFLKKMLEVSPDCLLRENAVGHTPYDLAKRLYLASKLKDPPTIIDTSNQWRGFAWGAKVRESQKKLIDRNETFFVEGDKKVKLPRDEIWEMCVEHLEKHKINRRLVSLAEANEVAKRLAMPVATSAGYQRSNPYNYQQSEENIFKTMPSYNPGLHKCPKNDAVDGDGDIVMD